MCKIIIARARMHNISSMRTYFKIDASARASFRDSRSDDELAARAAQQRLRDDHVHQRQQQLIVDVYMMLIDSPLVASLG